MQQIALAIVDDDGQQAQDIKDKLALSEEVVVLYEARNGRELMDILKKGDIPEVVLMDIQMPQMDGIEVTKQVKSQYPNIKILMLTVMDDEQKLFEALQAGASGYLLKDARPHHLLNAVWDVLEGGLPLSPILASKVLGYLKGEKPLPKPPDPATEVLTKREKEVLECLKRGLVVKKISEELFISNKTVRKHLEHIYQKLQVHSGREALFKGFGREVM
jgi:DNA-binding NarL/FixJ family response regulator